MLKALKYAESQKIRILNLPFNSKTLSDKRLIRRIKRMTLDNFVFVTSAGNDGSHFGTLYAPANSIYVTSVGAYDYSLNSISPFSSKGPYIGDLKLGTPIFKPDMLVIGSNILGSNLDAEKCIKKSGTSFSSTIFAGLIAKIFCESYDKMNIGAVNFLKSKVNALLTNKSIFEQGSGNLDFAKYCAIAEGSALLDDRAHIFFIPEVIDMRTNSDKYFFPINIQPLYKSETYRHVKFTMNSALPEEWQIVDVQKEYFPASAEKYFEIVINCKPKFQFTNKIDVKLRLILDVLLKIDVEINLVFTVANKSKQMNLKGRLKLLSTVIPRPNTSRIILFDNHHNLVYPFDGKPVK